MLVGGVDTSALPDQFDNAVAGRVLILDGDGPCYVASATAKRLDTALRNFQQEVLKRMFLAQAGTCRIHLTADDSDKHGRYRVIGAKPYQGNRQGKEKPPMLQALREAVADNATWLEEYIVRHHRDIEADDAMIQDAYLLKHGGVIWSEDKDLRMTPFPYYETATGKVDSGATAGFVDIRYTESGTPKMVGRGPIFFWGQMLTGDTADNIAGLRKYNGKTIGPVGAVAVLREMRKVDDAANAVLDAYREIDQNAVAEGWLLWLTRWRGDNFVNYLKELSLSVENRAFVDECVTRDWVKTPEETKRE